MVYISLVFCEKYAKMSAGKEGSCLSSRLGTKSGKYKPFSWLGLHKVIILQQSHNYGQLTQLSINLEYKEKRLLTFSSRYILFKCVLTVLTLINNSSAISSFVLPCMTRSMISS